MTRAYRAWFEQISGNPPHPWQASLGDEASCRDRLLRIPTGFGKTAGTVLPWLYHRVARADLSWPTRLVFCLPMRVLVEQTYATVRAWLDQAGLREAVGLELLMGGVESTGWRHEPDRPTVLIGTQDMLLSRALNRGYAASRAAWPAEFGLLHQDALWIMDEIQLMDVGLATSTQLAAFRAREKDTLRPSACWWMSATLQPSWLSTVDFTADAAVLSKQVLRIMAEERKGGLWDVRKPVEHLPAVSTPQEVAQTALSLHEPGTLTLVIVNTVARSIEVADALRGAGTPGSRRKRGPSTASPAQSPQVRLVHSRFRGAERAGWKEDFLRKDAPVPPEGRILVTTQVVEAGVDISAQVLVTDLAPWPSLVQRFGRAARYAGESAKVRVVGSGQDKKLAGPYEAAACLASQRVLDRLASGRADVSPAAIEALEESLAEQEPALLCELYPYAPEHVVRRSDLEDLFDTTPDLSGTDLDVSRFIRSGDERDVTVFWRRVEGLPRALSREQVEPPRRAELCPVPVHELRDWLKTKERTAYRFDFSSGQWLRTEPWGLAPGMTLLVPAQAGGYDTALGWSSRSTAPVEPVEAEALPELQLAAERSSAAEEDDSLSQIPSPHAWKSIATHGRETSQEVERLASQLRLSEGLTLLLTLAARWHDVGKAHPVFQAAIVDEARQEAGAGGAVRDLAKAPTSAWRRPPYPDRPGFRHELVSTVALLELVRNALPGHPGLGAEPELRAALGAAPPKRSDDVPVQHPLVQELAALDEDGLNLVLWLVCTHHGKVRVSWTATPLDQATQLQTLHGVLEGDTVPAVKVSAQDGEEALAPGFTVSLSAARAGWSDDYGPSWRERVARLLKARGPFQLAYLEALLRAADVRASRAQ